MGIYFGAEILNLRPTATVESSPVMSSTTLLAKILYQQVQYSLKGGIMQIKTK
jgi:hypothetical protein